ncbi:MAG TPA: DUF222 domain-containing protein [Acidimicrobiia bacterium]|nr:DUF222 domain-containing protein [Acidimicrobiia bacterium]
MVEHTFEGEGIPRGLAEMAPGPMLAAVLMSIDRNRITGYQRVVVMKARARLRAWVEAEFYADIQSVAEAELEVIPKLDEAMESAEGEIRAALTLTRRAAEHQLGTAYQLRDRLPEVWEALHRGRIDLPKARVLCNETVHLPVEDARRVADVALERAPRQTTGQLGARIRKLVISLDPDLAKDRYQEAVTERRVVLEPNQHGTTNLLGLDLPADQAQAAMRRINDLAKAAKTADDTRTMDQVRADVYLDLLNGHHLNHAKGRGMVDISVELTTLAGLDNHPGELRGYGPVIADIARQVASDQSEAEHRVTVTEGGTPIWTGTTRRRPTTHQTRQVEARNPNCVFPGCRTPASQSDLDHTHPYSDGGPTQTDNLAPLCRHDHQLKHQTRWDLKPTAPGVYQWTTPLGHTYTVGPDPP